MTVSPQKQRQIDRIEFLRGECEKLTARANHATMKNLVRLAVRDLDEGAVWMRQEREAIQEPWILAMVEFQCHLAEWRLNTVRWALDTYGPDAMMIGG